MNLKEDFSRKSILVLGDVMLDRYWQGNTKRISPEAPVPVVQVEDREERPGGAGNVAVNISALGASVILVGVVGADEAGDALRHHLEKAGVTTVFTVTTETPTTVKLRVIDRNQQLIRLDFDAGSVPSLESGRSVWKEYQKALEKVDAVVLSDYGKGVLNDPQPFIQAAVARGIPVLVDPKRDDFSCYRGATVITPNRKEFEQVVGMCHSESALVARGNALIREAGIAALLLTRGEKGMMLLASGEEAIHLPAKACSVYDVTGAGDTVIAVAAVALSLGMVLSEAAFLANLAAGLVVQKFGAATVTGFELQHALASAQGTDFRVLSEAAAEAVLRDAQRKGETVVMTNGCFDMLHAGHVTYLEQARALGDRLIVAVNDDASVSALKGLKRPIHSLEHRLQLLSALRCVDWVVSFSEETPLRLIRVLQPDILVKGGDYKDPQQVVGADVVLERGGSVKILPFVSGCSSTQIIEKIALSLLSQEQEQEMNV